MRVRVFFTFPLWSNNPAGLDPENDSSAPGWAATSSLR